MLLRREGMLRSTAIINISNAVPMATPPSKSDNQCVFLKIDTKKTIVLITTTEKAAALTTPNLG